MQVWEAEQAARAEGLGQAKGRSTTGYVALSTDFRLILQQAAIDRFLDQQGQIGYCEQFQCIYSEGRVSRLRDRFKADLFDTIDNSWRIGKKVWTTKNVYPPGTHSPADMLANHDQEMW